MDREEAAQALELLRKVAARARDDTALENWGLIWIFSAFSNGAGFFGTHLLFARGEATPWPFAGLWAGVLAVNGGIIAKFRQKSVSSGSFVEKQIWSLWTILVVAMILLAVVNYLMGLQHLFMPAVGSLMLAMIFAAMAPIMGKGWYGPAALWALLALGMALVPRAQFALLAGAWFLTQGSAGVWLDRQRRRRLAEGAS
jgi:hypothetical protein